MPFYCFGKRTSYLENVTLRPVHVKDNLQLQQRGSVFFFHTGTDYPSGAHEFTSNLCGVRVARFVNFLCNVLYIFVCPIVFFLLAIALSVLLQLMASDDSFVIFKLFVK